MADASTDGRSRPPRRPTSGLDEGLRPRDFALHDEHRSSSRATRQPRSPVCSRRRQPEQQARRDEPARPVRRRSNQAKLADGSAATINKQRRWSCSCRPANAGTPRCDRRASRRRPSTAARPEATPSAAPAGRPAPRRPVNSIIDDPARDQHRRSEQLEEPGPGRVERAWQRVEGGVPVQIPALRNRDRRRGGRVPSSMCAEPAIEDRQLEEDGSHEQRSRRTSPTTGAPSRTAELIRFANLRSGFDMIGFAQ